MVGGKVQVHDVADADDGDDDGAWDADQGGASRGVVDHPQDVHYSAYHLFEDPLVVVGVDGDSCCYQGVGNEGGEN